MGSQLIEVLRQGIWASFSGGWFHDPRQPLFTNTVHFYLWLLLLAFPLTLCIYFTSTLAIWTVYSGSIGFLFLVVKLLNCRLHHLFDTTEATELPLDQSSEIESPNEVVTKSKRDRPRNLGLGNVDEIELQVLDNPLVVPTNPGIVHRQRLALAEIGLGNPPRGNTQQQDSSMTIGRDLKVDVHRKESSSSSSTLSENSNESWNGDLGDKVPAPDKIGKSSTSSTSTNTPVNESVLGPSINNRRPKVSFSTPCSITQDKKCVSLSLTDVDKYATSSTDGIRNDGRTGGKNSMKLKQTSSMEFGHLNQDSSTRNQEMLGTPPGSATPRNRKATGRLPESYYRRFPREIKLADCIEPIPTRAEESKSEITNSVTHSEVKKLERSDKPKTRGTVGISKSAQSLGSQKMQPDLYLRRCKSEECKPSGLYLNEQEDSNGDEDDENDEAVRSRTPLLSHYSDKSSNDTEISWKPRDPNRLVKRVSFNSPSYSEDNSSSIKGEECSTVETRSETVDDKAALIPVEDSLCGWNQAGGPFTSEWEFHKTENGKGILEASSDKIKEIFDEDISFIDKDPSDSVSIKSGGSSGAHSLIGLDLLFDGSFGNKHEFQIHQPVDETTVDNAAIKLSTNNTLVTSSPKRLGRTVQQRRKYYPPRSAEEERKRRNYCIHTRIPPCDTEAMYQPGWKLERESNPRMVLERLLEESGEGSPSSSFGFAGPENIKDTFTPEISSSSSLSGELASGEKGGIGLTSAVSLPLTLREHNDESARQHSGAFLQSATRELKHQLRNLGTQNSLEIASADRLSGASGSHHRNHSNQFQGLFRPRDESLHFDIDSSTSTINRHRRLRRLALSRRSLERRRDFPYSPPLSAHLRNIAAGGTHVASSHDDTTEGAVHYFQDEAGNWHSYTFCENLVNEPSTSNPATNTTMKTPSSSESWSSVSSSELGHEAGTSRVYPHSSSKRPSLRALTNPNPPSHQTSISGGGSPVPSMPSLATMTPDYQLPPSTALTLTQAAAGRLGSLPVPGMGGGIPRTWQRNPRDVLQVLTESFLERRRNPGQYVQGEFHTFESFTGGRGVSSPNQDTGKVYPKAYYLMQPIPKFTMWKIKVWFDRLKLMAVFDRNRSFLETLIGIFLAVSVASLGSYMLHQGYYQDLTVVLLCLVMASCQFSLLKSVQPDAASPTHGFNHLVAFSRPIYFCICGGVVYLIQLCLNNEIYNMNFKIYGVDITDKEFLLTIQNIVLIIILCFPILFSVGLFPQFNTFLMYTFEQIDMHIFGGNAASSLFASFISNIKNFIAMGLLYGFAYGAIGEAQSTQHLLFSIFCGLLVATSYHMSRCASDPSVMWSVLKQHLCPDEDCFGDVSSTSGKIKQTGDEEGDPLPRKLRDTVNARLKSDLIICSVIGLLVFCLHASTVFTALQPGLTPVLWCVAVFLGFILHYVIPQFRKQLPCLLVAHPVLLPNEYDQFEAREPAKLMWFEKAYVFLTFFEKNIVYPVLFISAITEQSKIIVQEDKFGVTFGSLIIVITGLKALRTSFSDLSKHYLIIMFTILFFNFDWEGNSETLLIDFFFMSILLHKFYELWLKLQFVITYIAPWQITWGSAFHAFAQPFSVPHSAMLFLQAVVSSIFSAPLNPFLGSAIFITSYVRPIKFWERDYNTKRVDHSNTRLSAHLEKNPGADDNNLNSIFYEHLTRSLQDSLCGDLILGRWGLVSQGDCFVLASDYLNCLVHIVEVGNGLVTFQMRGLEFRGTYCQQREVEAISEGVEEDDGCCCCEPGHLPHMLSANAAFSQRWLAWEVTVAKYILEGYSIADNSAVSMLQVFDLRKILITYYVKSIIYYTLKADKLMEWLESEAMVNSLSTTLDKHYADLDPVFSVNIDEDYDFTASGITRNSFCNIYHSWIQHCVTKRQLKSTSTTIDTNRESTIVSLCFALSILGRRALGVAAHSNSLSSVEFFLFGLHALFKGDFRITSQRDEWVFCDMDLLKKVVSPAVRMSLKLHQDHFMCPDEYDDNNTLYDAITYHDDHLVISHEGDPAWRSAVLSGVPALLALRHVLDDGTDEYKIIMLNKRHLSFRVIKLNRECVRGLWAGQQQELVYLRNRDPERGSIQNAKQALRNIINSSCDQPIGYPIYVSPLTTSYADTHVQLCSLVGGPISFSKLKESAVGLWRRIRLRCIEGCSSGSSIRHEDTAYGQEGVYSMTSSSVPVVVSTGVNLSGSQSLDGSQIGGSSVGRSSLTRGNFSRGSVASNVSGSLGKPSTSTLASLAAGFLTDSNGNSRERTILDRDKDRPQYTDRETGKSGSLQRVRIVDANQVYDALNLGRRIDVVWPDEGMRLKGGQNYWHNWVPEDGMEGTVVHKWVPGHRDPKCRSITEKTIILLKIDDKYVPIAEGGVADLGAEV